MNNDNEKRVMDSKISLLIVEDETILAELHAEFVNRNPHYKTIGIASTCADAKLIIEKFRPTLVLLDKYLPDGQGLEVFDYIINNNLPCYVIFITAASDIETCSRVIRYGAFDFLIKPASYERLKHSLERFELFIKRQHNVKHLSQRRVDELFNLQTKDFTEMNRHTKGIEEITLQRIQEIFLNEKTPQTVDDIVIKAGVSKTTARRYLEYCVQIKFLLVEITYGKIGRPERCYKKT